MTPANPDDLIGRLIEGRYQVRSLIARGGMATVYVATDLRLERRVAIKIMHDHLAADDAFRARFIQEARSAAKLAHPNVVNVYDQGEDRGLAYIVMEYIPGITLRDLLHDHHRLTPEQTIDVMDAVLSGLQSAHRSGIVHRDLKPENVLLADDGRIKLSDFGLARAASANTASGQVLLGTIAYLAPELVTKGTADIRSDIYSLGIMMFEMLTGEQPYRGDQPVNIAFRHANEDVPPPGRLREGIPAQLDDLVVWATERDPEARPADAGAMLVALRQAEQEIEAGGGVPAVPFDPRQSVSPAGPARDEIVATAGDGRDDGCPAPGLADAPTRATEAPFPFFEDDPEPATARFEVPGAGPGGAPRSSTGAALLERPGDAVANPARRRRRRVWPALVAILAILVLVGGAGGWYFLAGPGSYHQVPNVVGATQEDATRSLEAEGFAVGQVVEAPSLEAPAGTVLSTDPAAGAPLAPDSPVALTVSSGPEQLTVPSLAGLTREQAIEAIEDARFAYAEGTDSSEFSSQPAGAVIRATDASGQALPTRLAEQSQIRLVLSAGPVPNVVGMTADQATAKLKEVGLGLAVDHEEFSATAPSGQIISASNPHEPVKPGDSISVVVSKGPDLVEVPNVVGKTTREAVAALEAAGFKVQHSVPANFLDQTKVTTQSPAPGTKQTRGSTITIQSSLQF